MFFISTSTVILNTNGIYRELDQQAVDIYFLHIPLFQRIVFGIPSTIDLNDALRVSWSGISFHTKKDSIEKIKNLLHLKTGSLQIDEVDHERVYGTLRLNRALFFSKDPSFELLASGCVAVNHDSRFVGMNLVEKRQKSEQVARRWNLGVWSDEKYRKDVKMQSWLSYIYNKL